MSKIEKPLAIIMTTRKIFCIPPLSIFNATTSLILKYVDNLEITFWHKNIKC